MVPLLEYHKMTSPDQNSDQFSWGYLIKPDKSPAPLLEQLCLGIADLIVYTPHT